MAVGEKMKNEGAREKMWNENGNDKQIEVNA